MIKQAVILAGGKGTRLIPLTRTIPKSMVPIKGKPFLWHQLVYLNSFGIKHFLILAGYLGHMIRDSFGNGNKMGISITYSFEKKLLGTGGALKKAENKILGDSFLLVNGDTYYTLNLRKPVDRFLSAKKCGMLTVYNNYPSKIASNNVSVDSRGLVTGYNKATEEGMNCVDAGLIALKRRVLDFIPKGKKISFEKSILPLLIEKRQLCAYRTRKRFFDIGTKHDLKYFKESLL